MAFGSSLRRAQLSGLPGKAPSITTGVATSLCGGYHLGKQIGLQAEKQGLAMKGVWSCRSLVVAIASQLMPVLLTFVEAANNAISD